MRALTRAELTALTQVRDRDPMRRLAAADVAELTRLGLIELRVPELLGDADRQPYLVTTRGRRAMVTRRVPPRWYWPWLHTTAGGALAPVGNREMWVLAGLVAQFLGLGIIGVAAFRYGSDVQVPPVAGVLILAGALVEVAGAVVLARAYARGRRTFAVYVPLAIVFGPLFVVGRVLLTLAGVAGNG